MSVLKTRIILGTAMLVAFCGIIYIDYAFNSDIGIGILGTLAGAICLFEFYNIVEKKGFAPFKVSGIIGGIIVFLGLWFSTYEEGLKTIYSCILFPIVFWLFFVQALKRGIEDTIKNISVTVFGIIYICFFLSFIMLIRHMPNGLSVILIVLLLTKGGDIGGYLFGRKFGRHKFSSFSPNKTIEGASFALFCSLMIAIGLNALPGMRVLPFYLIVPFGLLVGASGIIGDLIESIIKRDMAVKDSSSAIPAFGGLLDILDSLLISIPVAYFFLIIVKY
ncbi:MAG: phosphatidate cytidylyltransferase [Candidatus Scalindua sp.]|jgi:phosphatidate cytidylyltransferase|nr:phosphatidate cytidylyltransferase [Candidatus Scalindua sp.]MBT6052723.1 phosphatidate cytidylyltransferase [Candidatus Scalindua sp.]MBT6228770.1 phosphatidate cytidylyltransferase [Candidatus Scalindua sp.]MBT6564264.1 phosphatidate cytidylyltransferase [Candidatus Scalindua sp.]MBT7209940.1 phosphatidate cytidylyltransferase [Candidatus Scalindua sp.]